jgi:predicted DsbA family dithiol-disulfide isomerase
VHVGVRYITDPACPVSWATEPKVRKLMVEFGEDVVFTYVMGGLARTYEQADHRELLVEWLRRADEDAMPLDPLLWEEGPLGSTYPACMAVTAAGEQGQAGSYLRAVREGIMCFRRKLDTSEALVEEARRARLDVERFRIDLASHAIVERFGADLEEARGVALPTLGFVAEDGEVHRVAGTSAYEELRDAAVASGARPAGGAVPGPLEALKRFGRMATAEVEAVCELPGPPAQAELWRLASEWKAKPVRVLTGWLWEPI